jgi:hypothetical protein
MPLPLPNLDTRRYDDLVAEMRALIPQLAPEWSNHNIADPGITLIELLAWLTEATLYRLNRTPEATYWNLIRLLRPESDASSPSWGELQKQSLSSARIQAVQWFKDPYRAVTASDFERLVLELFSDGIMKIARAKAVANDQRGIVTVIVVPRVNDPFTVAMSDDAAIRQAFVATRDAVKGSLDKRRLVGTRVRVRAPVYRKLTVGIDVLPVPDTDPGEADALKRAIQAAVVTLLHPVDGGEDGGGWPFGRPVSIHDLAPTIESVPGVAEVRHVLLDDDPQLTEIAIPELPWVDTSEPDALTVTVAAV